MNSLRKISYSNFSLIKYSFDAVSGETLHQRYDASSGRLVPRVERSASVIIDLLMRRSISDNGADANVRLLKESLTKGAGMSIL